MYGEGEGFQVEEDAGDALSADVFDACAGLSFESLEEFEIEGEVGTGVADARELCVEEAVELNELVSREIDEYEQTMDGVNVSFDPFDIESPYNTNCGSCALACEMRLSGEYPEAVAGARNVGTPHEMNEATGKVQVSMDPREIVEFAKQQGPGYHGVVGFDWADTRDGHWINVSVSPSSHVYALDAQCGRAILFDEYVETYAKNGTNWDLSR